MLTPAAMTEMHQFGARPRVSLDNPSSGRYTDPPYPYP